MESEDDPSGHCGFAGWQSATLTYERLHPAEHHDLEMLPASGWIMQPNASIENELSYRATTRPARMPCIEENAVA